MVDDSEISSATHYDYNAGVIHTVEFPTGSILRQVLPIYFDSMFTRTIYEKDLSFIPSQNQVVIDARIDNINFSQKCCLPTVLEVNARTKFIIYDNDLIEIALPVYGIGYGTTSKSGLFVSIDKKKIMETQPIRQYPTL